MKKLGVIVCACLCLCLAFTTATAGDFDGSKPFICAVINLFECQAGGTCEPVALEATNLPRFLRIDCKNKSVSGTLAGGTVRTTNIEGMEHLNGLLILQGTENGKAWSMSVNEESGKAVLSAVGEDVAFVVFGACVLPSAD